MKTDFSTWKRETLEIFAREVADENLELTKDQKILFKQIRDLILENAKLKAATVPPSVA